MLHLGDLYPYQSDIIDHIVANPASMLWVDMGYGKTVAALTANSLLQQLGQIRATLVVAPINVAHTVWDAECLKWSHLRHLRVSKILGDPVQRMHALQTPADVYVTNYESMQWLRDYLVETRLVRGNQLPFDAVIWDEVDKLKNKMSKRSRAFRTLAPYIRRRCGMTGTPASQGLIDLHGQYLVVDDGARLGTSIQHYRDTYFWQERYNLNPYNDSAERVMNLVKDITFSLRNEEPLVPVRDMIYNIDIGDSMQQYRTMERELFAELDTGTLVAANAAVRSGKCLQLAGGAVYTDDERSVTILHDRKIVALERVLAGIRSPVLVAYNYQHERDRIMQRFPHAVCAGGVAKSQLRGMIDAFGRGEIRMLVAHPASFAHGIDGLQQGGCDLIWFGLPWSLRLYKQFIARLARPGQKSPAVNNHILLASRTLDSAVHDRLSHNEEYESAMIDAIKRYRQALASAS